MSPFSFHSGKSRFLSFWVIVHFLLMSIPPICPVNIFLSVFKIILQEAGSPSRSHVENHVLKTQMSDHHPKPKGEGSHPH